MKEEMPIGSEYDLTEEEYISSLSRAEMGVFMTCKPSKHPYSVFVVAQPGAGKTGLKTYVINQGQNTGRLASFVEFNPDNIGPYHEHYAEIMRHYPDDSFQILQRFIRPALDEHLRRKGVDLKVNVVQEGTFASKDGYLSILDYQKNGGYDIDVAILAVDRYESLLSCYEREQYYRENGLTPRIVQPRYHDDSYVRMLETLDEIERRNLISRTCAFKRGYVEGKPELVWQSGDSRFASSREAIDFYRQRNREEIMQNADAYIRRITSLQERAEDIEQQSRLARLLEEFQTELEKYNER